MRKSVNITAYIDDLNPDPLQILHQYKDRILVKLNGYVSSEVRDIVTDALVSGDYTIRVSGRRPGHPVKCLGWESVPGGVAHWEQPVTEMIGSFKLNEILCRYAHEGRLFKTEEFTLNGVPHTMQAGGYVLREGVPILRVIDDMPVPTCLRLAGTASENYSFTNEIPVRALSGEDMHDVNYKAFGDMILNTLAIPNMNIRAQFNLVLGIRRWAFDYSNIYRIPHLPMTEGEMSVLAKTALFDGGSIETQHILRMYRGLYGLSEGDHLPGLDQDDLNAISASQA